MKKSFYALSMCLITIIILSSCSSNKKSEDTFESNEAGKSTLQTIESKVLTTTSESSFEYSTTTSSEMINEKLDAYNNLPLYVKIQLIAEIVDNRAYPEGGKRLKDRGYVIGYYVDSNSLILQVGSGIGVGHPVYLLHYNEEIVTPKEGVARVSASEYEIMSDIDLSAVSKETLYDNYLANKDAYDNGYEEVTEREDMREYFDFQKEEALRQIN